METNIHCFGVTEESLPSVTEQAKDFAISLGITMRTPELPLDARIPAPFCLVPSAFPKKWFDYVCSLQCHLNLVLFKIAHSKEFLRNCLSSTIEADDFTANIFKIFETVDSENRDQQLSLGLIRSDYLLNADLCGNILGIKQVENNTISSSFAGLTSRMKCLHKFVLTRLGLKYFEDKLPSNNCLDELAYGIVSAYNAYNSVGTAVLFIVEENIMNIDDQRALEYAIYSHLPELEILKCSFEELKNCAKLDEKKLLVNNKEIAIVYYRVGYMPDHYRKEDWETRLMIERSSAIKCPSAGLHLAGTKRVQWQLSQPGVLEEFVPIDVAVKLREVFAHQYSLDQSVEGDAAVELGLANPEKYVLKPEREGGGNNIYGENLKNALERMKTSSDRNAYILMERICPPTVANCIVRANRPTQIHDVVGELGVFGVILGSKTSININKFSGHLLRSKKSNSDESGVVAGFGALDTLYLE